MTLSALFASTSPMLSTSVGSDMEILSQEEAALGRASPAAKEQKRRTTRSSEAPPRCLTGTPPSVTPRSTCERRHSTPSYEEKERMYSLLSASGVEISGVDMTPQQEMGLWQAFVAAMEHKKEDHMEQ